MRRNRGKRKGNKNSRRKLLKNMRLLKKKLKRMEVKSGKKRIGRNLKNVNVQMLKRNKESMMLMLKLGVSSINTNRISEF